MLFRTRSYARAGLLGNPSDGYYGKTIAFSIEDFPVDVTIYESPELKIEPGDVDMNHFTSLHEMVNTVQHYGYYGGIRLIKATIKVFAHYCHDAGIELPERNFTIRYFSTVPRLVGLGGSSAICTATFKALMKFYDVRTIPFELIPTLCWRAESEELGIQCGMQDRVIQVYEGMAFMDFGEQFFTAHQHGRYEWLDTSRLPRLYLAYDPNRAEFSGIYHRKLRVLFEEQKKEIVAAMSEFADLAQQGRDAIVAGNMEALPGLVNANFDLRHRVFKVTPENVRMVETARRSGASAKFAGSGGAIVGTYEDERMYQRLVRDLQGIDCTVLRPCLPPPQNPEHFPA